METGSRSQFDPFPCEPLFFHRRLTPSAGKNMTHVSFGLSDTGIIIMSLLFHDDGDHHGISLYVFAIAGEGIW